MHTFRRGRLVFDVSDDGPADGEIVVLLHGFPQRRSSWRSVSDRLTEQGYRTLAPDQRGYSPRANPRGRWSYRMGELVDDVVALIEAAGGGPVHVVGHDWGAAVAWSLASRRPELVRTVTALSVPHPAAYLRAMWTSKQGLLSWYMYAFQLPWVPELLITSRRGRVLRRLLERIGQSPEVARRDAQGFGTYAAARGAVNWYRAMFLADPRDALVPVVRPTLFVWSDGDTAIARRGAELCADWVRAPYRFEVLTGVSHWIPDEAPDAVAELLLEHLA